MSVYGKGSKGKADRLFSLLIRFRGSCQRCSATDNLQCAHIIRRRYNATRTDERNAWCLCARCHWLTEEQPDEFMDLVERTVGRELYDELKHKAQAGVKANEAFWLAECERLKTLLKEAA
jgi:5-methylcytosine-specific restriction endonuclease McrA